MFLLNSSCLDGSFLPISFGNLFFLYYFLPWNLVVPLLRRKFLHIYVIQKEKNSKILIQTGDFVSNIVTDYTKISFINSVNICFSFRYLCFPSIYMSLHYKYISLHYKGMKWVYSFYCYSHQTLKYVCMHVNVCYGHCWWFFDVFLYLIFCDIYLFLF